MTIKEESRKVRRTAVYLMLTVLVSIAFFMNLGIGNVNITFGEIWNIFIGKGMEDVNSTIIMDIRLPRVLMAFVLGGGLAVSGFLLQTYFSNPIAGPYILGISSGAKMMVAIVLIFVVGSTGRSSNLLLVSAAFVGAIVTTGFMILISRVVSNMAVLLAAGIMVGYICSAITDFLIAFADDSDIVNLHSWSQGSFSGIDMGSVYYAFVLVGIMVVLVMLLTKPLDALRLTENYARSLGVNVRFVRLMVILISSVLSACVTAFVGPVSFIGIAVPFLMRELLATSRPIVLIPATFLAGSVFCMFSDLLARQLFAPTELNISAVTSLFGAPIVIYMIVRRHGRNEA
ncbi:FecCD family ABC transporter permease [Butyrivibrio sp. INlla14]|uniref:FecCD family ABC transporter permease n=1 Tax=Butyrivibrio sp. INlla14 TaxID=1520808 RepID=UPI000876E776|nr:iron ABC transporter permease [Butyrivibrio sp. INlla14]SCY02583.1 iron complex transport system permease protein [Butyrivibrio sp. INlla14]